MTIAYRGTGTSGNTGSAVASVTITLPTGFQAGDLLFVIIRIGGQSPGTVTQTGGTGTWVKDFQNVNTSGNFTTVVFHRVMASGDTNPTFGWSAGARINWSCGGFFSSTGGTLSLDKYSPSDPAFNGTAGTSWTPNAVTGAGGTEASIILTAASASANNTTTTHTYTPPTGWTWNDGDGGFSNGTSGSVPARFAAHCYELGVSGTVTPGSESLTDSASDNFFFAIFHALVQEASGLQAAPPAHAPVRAPVPQVFSKGRAGGNPGAPVRNPVQGAAFPAPQGPARARLPQLGRTGRVASSAGAPVANPTAGPVFRLAVRAFAARLPVPFLKGRTSGNAGAPVRNPGTGPAVRAPRGPARAALPSPPRGRAAGTGAAAVPVTPSPAPVYPLHGPVAARRPLPSHGRVVTGNPGAPVRNPGTGPVVYPAHGPVAARFPGPFRKGSTRAAGASIIPVPVHLIRVELDLPFTRWLPGQPYARWKTG